MDTRTQREMRSRRKRRNFFLGVFNGGDRDRGSYCACAWRYRGKKNGGKAEEITLKTLPKLERDKQRWGVGVRRLRDYNRVFDANKQKSVIKTP